MLCDKTSKHFGFEYIAVLLLSISCSLRMMNYCFIENSEVILLIKNRRGFAKNHLELCIAYFDVPINAIYRIRFQEVMRAKNNQYISYEFLIETLYRNLWSAEAQFSNNLVKNKDNVHARADRLRWNSSYIQPRVVAKNSSNHICFRHLSNIINYVCLWARVIPNT